MAVRFLVLHYTACSLPKTLGMFQDPQTKASSHLVVDRDGAVYETVPCLNGQCFKAWHAGESQWQEQQSPTTARAGEKQARAKPGDQSVGGSDINTPSLRARDKQAGEKPGQSVGESDINTPSLRARDKQAEDKQVRDKPGGQSVGGSDISTKFYERFNNFSIGVELINYNGNLFEYTTKQYQSLKGVLERLKAHYPALQNPNRILGHEHIAGHRGKVDPGHCFDWPLFFKMSYPDFAPPIRKAILPEKQRKMFLKLSREALSTAVSIASSPATPPAGSTPSPSATPSPSSPAGSSSKGDFTDAFWVELNKQMEQSFLHNKTR